ncbi:MAG: hypothetical protein U0X93_11730 [Anaerolineales bacterium]
MEEDHRSRSAKAKPEIESTCISMENLPSWLARIVAAWLKVGDTLDEAKFQKMELDDARERALQQALLFLSYRA